MTLILRSSDRNIMEVGIVMFIINGVDCPLGGRVGPQCYECPIPNIYFGVSFHTFFYSRTILCALGHCANTSLWMFHSFNGRRWHNGGAKEMFCKHKNGRDETFSHINQ
jgi:hypothetical protein